jgi:hypothetical protein
LLAVTVVFALAASAAPAQAHKASGVAGTVFDTTCAGGCPPPCGPVTAMVCPLAAATPTPYAGSDLTVTVRRVRDDLLLAARHPTDGRFRIRLRHGIYSVTATVGNPITAQSAATPQPVDCWTTETKQVGVHRHRFAHIDLHVQNYCVAQPL